MSALVFAGSHITVSADSTSFTQRPEEIHAHLDRMACEPVGLARPIIVLSGYRGHSGAARELARKIRELTGADESQVLTLSYMFDGSIEEPARKLVALVEEHFPSGDPELTSRVDIVGISMGGLVARAAAADPALIYDHAEAARSKRLSIGTLYTLATPHRGARLANRIRVDDASAAMASGSTFLAALDAELETATYDIVPYAVLRDRWVGATRTAPIGQDPIWIAGQLVRSHHMVSKNQWIQADLGRRLRGEEPLGRPSEPPRD